jgi:hypothetical protein
VARIIVVGGPRFGKSTLARAERAKGVPTFCGDPVELVKEPEAGVTYLPSGMAWSDGSQYVADNWFTMPGPWLCEGQIMARALRKWTSKAAPADRIIVLTGPPHVAVTPGQAAMIKAVETVWHGIAHHFDAITEYR